MAMFSTGFGFASQYQIRSGYAQTLSEVYYATPGGDGGLSGRHLLLDQALQFVEVVQRYSSVIAAESQLLRAHRAWLTCTANSAIDSSAPVSLCFHAAVLMTGRLTKNALLIDVIRQGCSEKR